MCIGCSDGSPSSRLVRLKLKFQKPRLWSGLFFVWDAKQGHVITFVVADGLCELEANLVMARSLRIEKENGIYHIINRGNYRQDFL
jgi:hypothetical protein